MGTPVLHHECPSSATSYNLAFVGKEREGKGGRGENPFILSLVYLFNIKQLVHEHTR